MAFNKQAAKAAGYSDQEINNYLAQQKASSQPQAQQQQPNFLQSLLGGLKSLGLGAVQDLAAGNDLATQELLHGRNPTVFGGDQPTPQELNQYASNNPFATKEQLGQMGGTPQQAVTQAGKDAIGAGSWMTPIGAEGMLARGGLGAAQGAMQGLSQDGANPASIGTNAGASALLNMINPLISKGLQAGASRLALGAGGEKFPQIVKEVGPITGSGKQLANTLYSKMQPIRDTFDQILNDSTGGVSKDAIFGKKTVSGAIDKDNAGMLGDVINNTGISTRPAALQYASQLQNHLNDLHTQYLADQGLHSNQILNLVNDSTSPTPLPVVQKFLHDLGGDTKVWDSSSPVGMMAKKLYGNIRQAVADQSGNTDQYNKLQGMKQAGAQMGENLTEPKRKGLIPIINRLNTRSQRLAVTLGTGGIGAAGVLASNPLVAIPALSILAAEQPAITTRAVSFANSPIGKLLGNATQRGTAGAISNSLTTPQ